MNSGPLKIVAIDDNEDSLAALRTVLAEAFPQVRVFTAGNGREGIELALAKDPDVVLLALALPEMDGFEVCRRLKADDRLSSIPVVILTALGTDRQNRIKALEEGADAFLSKPFDQAELIAQIRAMAKIKAAGERQERKAPRWAAWVAQRTRELERELAERERAEEVLHAHRRQVRALASELTLAEERERRRIAANLHDHTCQDLVLAKMNLQTLLADTSAAGGSALREIDSTLGEIIACVRELTFDLSSPTLYKFGLAAALEELLEDKLGVEPDLQCEFSDDRAPKPLTEDVQVLLFRSVRELLINIFKHAQAHKVTLDIRRVGDSIRIAVTDDGVGFDTDEVSSLPARHHGFGLFSIRERLDCIGGALEIDSRRGAGSRFILVAPLQRESRDGGRKHEVGEDSACR